MPEEGEPRQINSASALWQRPKSDLTAEDYKQAYKSIAGAFDDPAMTLHYRAEGRQSYAVLLFAPSTKPFDLFEPDRKGRVKLYVRRVFIADDAELLPGYLRFIRGVIDSEDLPLNISREMLQNNPQLAQIRKAVTGRVIGELENLGEKEPETFAKIWDAFGPVIKEGIWEDFERREKLLALSRFTTTTGEKRSLKQYVEDLKPNQTEIYYLDRRQHRAAEVESEARIRDSPRHRSAAADRSGRCVLDLGADRFRRQAAEIAEPGRHRFQPDPAARRQGRRQQRRERRRRGRNYSRDQGRARRPRLRRAGVAAADIERILSGGRRRRARQRARAAIGAAEPRRGYEADPRDQHAPSDGGGDFRRHRTRPRISRCCFWSRRKSSMANCRKIRPRLPPGSISWCCGESGRSWIGRPEYRIYPFLHSGRHDLSRFAPSLATPCPTRSFRTTRHPLAWPASPLFWSMAKTRGRDNLRMALRPLVARQTPEVPFLSAGTNPSRRLLSLALRGVGQCVRHH